MERGDGEAACIPEREVRETRQARLVHVDDVEAIRGQRELEVCPDAHGDAETAAGRDRNRGPERDGAIEGSAVAEEALQRAAPGCELGGAGRRREDDDVVTAPTELARRSGNVLVDGVRARPGERRHHADAQGHGADSSAASRNVRPETRAA